MPYTKANLPDHVKALGDKAQRQWMHVANGCMADGGDDAKCIRMANGVVKSANKSTPVSGTTAGVLTPDEVALVEEAKSYQYVDSWEYSEHQLDQASAGYNPLGATSDKGCANCQWFIAPGRCVVVAGTISPTGLSNLWSAQAVYSPTPIPVTIVDAATATPAGMGTKSADGPSALANSTPASDPGVANRLLSAVKSALGLQSDTAAASANPPVLRADAPFTLIKTKEGQLRFFTAWSNNFEDREGEIFTEDAHKEFVDWAYDSDQFPELWQWHTKGTRYGQVDWLDCSDGFVFASGLIDAGKEAIAEQVSREDSGVSHGFVGLRRGKEYLLYRSYEISTLPRENAAVWTTSFNLAGTKGAEKMGFTDKRRTYLLEHGMTKEQVDAAETQATTLRDSLKAAGVQWKDADLEPEAPAAPVTAAPATTAPAPATATTSTPADGDKAIAAVTDLRSELLGAINKQTEALTAIAGTIKSIDDRVKAVEEADDAKIAETIAGRRATTTGVRASTDASNVVQGAKLENTDKSWFDSMVAGGFGGAVPATTQAS